MQSTFSEATLSMADFTRYFGNKHLGKLYFPNGKCIIPHGISFGNAEFPNFFVDLADLYKMISGWTVSGTAVPLDDIIGIIAFGSAVRFPGVRRETTTRRKYRLFGEKITVTKEQPIQPNDADFLVVTNRDLMREEVLEPITLHTYDCGTWIRRGGIHVVNRGVSQLLKGVAAGTDTISISALREGVPVFYNDTFTKAREESKVESATPRKLLWDECVGLLIGRIV